jgi:APA family basic amino acid/polyamine antiporter
MACPLAAFTPLLRLSAPPQKVPLIAAVAIVAGSMVGVGVFTGLGFQLEKTPSAFPVLLLWVIGGLLTYFGAVNYAELSAMFPRSGGEYQLLSRVYHPGVGFVGGWVSLTAGFPAPVAASALVAGNYACTIAGGESQTVAKLIAAGIVITVTGAHMISVRFSGRFQWMATGLNLLLILGFTVCGFLLPEAKTGLLPKAGDGVLVAHPDFYVSLIYVLYAYLGWNAACYIAGEVENPVRNVPRALFIGTALITVLYTVVNAAMLNAAPVPELVQSGEGVAFTAARHIFGESGGRIMAGLIAFALISSISAMMWAGPRVAQQIGRDYPMLSFLARTDSRGVPWMGTALQAILAVTLIVASDKVSDIVTRTTFLLELMLLLTVWGVVHLRIRRPDLERPYKAWGYPYTTIAFLIMVAWTLSQILRQKPEDTRWGLGLLVIGVALYFAARTPESRKET